jgi:hypothetical protein
MICAHCGSPAARILRGRRILVALCDDCVLPITLMDDTSRELRVVAVAVERLLSGERRAA